MVFSVFDTVEAQSVYDQVYLDAYEPKVGARDTIRILKGWGIPPGGSFEAQMVHAIPTAIEPAHYLDTVHTTLEGYNNTCVQLFLGMQPRTGNGLFLDGTNDWAAPLTPFAVSNTFTWETRLQPLISAGFARWSQLGFIASASKDNPWPANHAELAIAVNNNTIQIYEQAGNQRRLALEKTVHMSDWTHVAIVYQDRQPTLYVNGVAVATGPVSPYAVVHPPATIGSPDASQRIFLGHLDNIMLWNVARTANEIQTIDSSPIDFDSPTLIHHPEQYPNLIAYYPFDFDPYSASKAQNRGYAGGTYHMRLYNTPRVELLENSDLAYFAKQTWTEVGNSPALPERDLAYSQEYPRYKLCNWPVGTWQYKVSLPRLGGDVEEQIITVRIKAPTAVESYAAVSENGGSAYHVVAERKVRLMYTNQGSDQIRCALYNARREQLASTTIPVVYGDNFLTIDWSSVAVETNTYYFVEITDRKGEQTSFKLKFSQ